MQLIEEGAIRLDGKITDYLKEYRGDTGDKITIHHLLTHQSGIIDFCYYEKFWSQYSKNTFSNEFLLREFYSNDLEFEPGTKVNYCNTGYSILALIIEKVTGKSYEENLKIRITQPLQMKNTGVIKTDSPLENMAIGYINRFLEWEPSFIEMNNFMGCGNIYSTLYDLYKWNQALSSNQLLSEEYMQIMFKPNLENYAYGWIVEDVVINEDTLENIYHQGHIDGFCSIISRIEDTTTTIILLHNGGVTKVYEKENIIEAVNLALTEDDTVIIEEFIEGIEVSCGILKTSKKDYTFPVTEIATKNDYFDTEAKYDPSLTDEITPARITDDETKRVQDACSFIYDKLNCKGMVRIDFIVKNGKPYFLEVNSIPGMSAESIIPKQIRTMNVSLTDIFTEIIEDSF